VVTATGSGSKHYGSYFIDTEYKNDAVSLSAAILFLPTTKLNLNLSGNYLDAKGSLEMGSMPEVPSEVTSNIAAADYDYSYIGQYSDLEYTQMQLTLGAEYAVSNRVSLTGEASYIDLTDDQGYVYGIESGSFYVFRTGVKVGF
jgi:hypothetical protein